MRQLEQGKDDQKIAWIGCMDDDVEPEFQNSKKRHVTKHDNGE